LNANADQTRRAYYYSLVPEMSLTGERSSRRHDRQHFSLIGRPFCVILLWVDKDCLSVCLTPMIVLAAIFFITLNFLFDTIMSTELTRCDQIVDRMRFRSRCPWNTTQI